MTTVVVEELADRVVAGLPAEAELIVEAVPEVAGVTVAVEAARRGPRGHAKGGIA